MNLNSYNLIKTGFKKLPESGDVIFVLESENKAKLVS